MTSELEQLTRIFRELGANNPEGWARSQVETGTPQLHRFLFLRQAWKLVSDENNDGWIDNILANHRRSPSARGRAIERLLALGADRADLVDLVRDTQYETLFGLCYLLGDPGLYDEADEQVNLLGWALVTTDAQGEPTSQTIDSLHEEVLSMDPTGREMRPRP
jgi:hypothetical protein